MGGDERVIEEGVAIEDLGKDHFVLLISWFDNGAQMQLLAESLREYTNYHALHINAVKAAPMLFDSDVWLKEIDTPLKQTKLRLQVKDADFFIFSEFLPNSKEMQRILQPLGLADKVTLDNCIIRTGGSIVKYNAEHYLMEWLKHGWMYAGGYHDYSISSQVGLVAPTRNICPIDKLPKPSPPTDTVRVCFAPTKERKGVKPFERVSDRLEKEYDNAVEFVPIVNKTWVESVKIKSTCHFTVDQFWIPTYANSSLESMAMSHVVLSRIDKWTLLQHPDLPIVNVWNEQELYEKIMFMLDDPDAVKELGKKGRAFVEQWHHPKVIVEQWDKLIDFVKGGRSERRERSD